MPRQRVSPPSPGRPLIEQLRLTAHAVDRFRRRAPELAGEEPRARLAELIEREAVVLSKPPSWFHGGPPSGGFLLGIQGRYVLPVRRVTSTEVILARPWRATTFVSRDLSPEDLSELTGDQLASLTLVSERIARKWFDASPGNAAAAEHRAGAVAQLRRELAGIPAGDQALSWVPERVGGRDELHVTLAGGTLVLVRAQRSERHAMRFRTVTWIPHHPHRSTADMRAEVGRHVPEARSDAGPTGPAADRTPATTHESEGSPMAPQEPPQTPSPGTPPPARDLPPVPPPWRRALRLPRQLARELRWALRHRWQRLRWRLRHGRVSSGTLRRMWVRTDPHWMERMIDRISGIAVPEPASPAPTPGTEVQLSGRLHPGQLSWGVMTLDHAELNDALAQALRITPGTPAFDVEIRIRVIDAGTAPAADSGQDERE